MKTNINKSIDISVPTNKKELIEILPFIQKISKEFKPIELQDILENMLHPIDLKNERLFDFAQRLKSKFFDLNDELHELMSELPHKPWKKDKCLKIDDKEYINENLLNILMEMIDSQFFYLTLQNMVLNKIKSLVPELKEYSNFELTNMLYYIKYQNNLNRVFSGDFELKSELTENEKNIISKILNNNETKED